LTQAEVAKAIGTTRQYYSEIERGLHMPRRDMRTALAELFGMTALELRDQLKQEA